MTDTPIEALVADLYDNADLDEMEGCNPAVVALERRAAKTLTALTAELAQVKAERDALADACQRARAYINGPGTDRTKPILRQLDDALALRKEGSHG